MTERTFRILVVLVAVAALAVLSLFAGGPRAQASTTGSIYFVNGNDNPSSFKCYRYVSGAWKTISVANGATISRSTKIKCNHKWKSRLIGGGSLPYSTTLANKVVVYANAQTGPYDTVSAGWVA